MSNPTPQNTPDEIDDFLHLVADGWGIEFFDLGVEDKHSELLDLIERCEADIRQELTALITAARIGWTLEAPDLPYFQITFFNKNNTPFNTDEPYASWTSPILDTKNLPLQINKSTLTNDKIGGEHDG